MTGSVEDFSFLWVMAETYYSVDRRCCVGNAAPIALPPDSAPRPRPSL
ncbi:hypothetical protein J4457_06860 [Candidatus Woesearchaeota archaeon]|nr:hypothetical protein [Candidatus Woesearchaeota archaeon]